MMDSLKKSKKMIRVLVVDDSPLVVKIISDILNRANDIGVVAVAHDGEEAIRLTTRLKPDIITMDINLPKKNGLETTKEIMAYQPTPILVISSNTNKNGVDLSFDAISLGALEVLDKGNFHNESFLDSFSTILLDKIRLLSRVKTITHPMGRQSFFSMDHSTPPPLPKSTKKSPSLPIVGIGASTGGPQVIPGIIRQLPEKFPFSIMIVQHIIPAFAEGFGSWLESMTRRPVKIAHSGEVMEPGKIYLPPGDSHLELSSPNTIRISKKPHVLGQRPSANLMFSSIAKFCPHNSMGVILSGMGADGLDGLTEMYAKGAPIIAQDEASCVVYGMPCVCVEAGIVTSVAPASEVGKEIMRLGHSHLKGVL